MARKRGGGARPNAGGILQFDSLSGVAGDEVIEITYVLAGEPPDNFSTWLWYSKNGAAFVRGAVPESDLEVTDAPSNAWGVDGFEGGDVVQWYFTVTGNGGELLTKSPVNTTEF